MSIAINVAAALLAFVGLLILLSMSQDGRALASFSVYGVTLVAAYSSSAAYHLTRGSKRGQVFQAADHCTIYLLIAGTYTPFAVLALWDRQGLFLLAMVWTLAVAGILVRIFWIQRLHPAAPTLYVILGWAGLGWAESFAAALNAGTLLLLVSGGLLYTVGALIVSRSTTERGDVPWHLCAVAGSSCHFAAVLQLAGS